MDTASYGTSTFITTEPPSGPGRNAEQRVWDAVRAAYSKEPCLGYWRYPIFDKSGGFSKEPDVLVAHPTLGIVVIEVKAVSIERIREISGHRWSYRDHYVTSDAPYQQARAQLFALLGFFNSASLYGQVGGRALVALPNVTEADWNASGFAALPSAPPILFGDQMTPAALRETVTHADRAHIGSTLSPSQWRELLVRLAGHQLPPEEEPPPSNLGEAARAVGEKIYEIDLQQEHIAKTIPPGAQRLRGIAGSGKTVLLCQKAAHMHLKHPDWTIALVFFTRSLYDQIERLVDQYVKRFSSGTIQRNPRRLQILHAWGARERDGLYRALCDAHDVGPLGAKAPGLTGSPPERLAQACARLLDHTDITPQFDAILIDESQDLVVDEAYKSDGKQPIFWLAFEALRPSSPDHPDLRRLIWAYDEAQSLDTPKIPKAKELFGSDDRWSRLVSGSYPGGIQKSTIMRRCYRTPGLPLVVAHTLGMGLLRPKGPLAGFSTQDDWEAIGYQVKEGDFLGGDKTVRLYRPAENVPNPTHTLSPAPTLSFHTYSSWEEELDALTHALHHDLRDGLRPSRDVLVVVVTGHRGSSARRADVHRALEASGISAFAPTALQPGDLFPAWPQNDSDAFWYDGAVTVSRVHRAKGNEAAKVYVVGLEALAQDEGDRGLRNQLFVAMTRARSWVRLSGTGTYPFYEEVSRVIEAVEIDAVGGITVSFIYREPDVDRGEDYQHDLFSQPLTELV